MRLPTDAGSGMDWYQNMTENIEKAKTYVVNFASILVLAIVAAVVYVACTNYLGMGGDVAGGLMALIYPSYTRHYLKAAQMSSTRSIII